MGEGQWRDWRREGCGAASRAGPAVLCATWPRSSDAADVAALLRCDGDGGAPPSVSQSPAKPAEEESMAKGQMRNNKEAEEALNRTSLKAGCRTERSRKARLATRCSRPARKPEAYDTIGPRRGSAERLRSTGRALEPHSGMLSCFFHGFSSFLLRSIASYPG